ncbi:MAG: glycoside hydrolase family protein [Brevundimonas sp.]
MSDTATPRMKVSREGIVLIKSFEGFRPRAVREDDGRWVIGYGHTASAREGLTVNEADAELLLQYDLLPVVKALNERVEGPLNQHQFDALASFAISVGVDRFLASDVLQRVNEGRAGQAADALIGWPQDVAADASLRRRAAERALFVADPASAVTLAELLAAPLPPPPIVAAPDPAPAPDSTWAPVPPAFETAPFEPADAITRVDLSHHAMDRYSPYSAVIIGPLEGFGPADPVEPSEIAGADAPVEPTDPEVDAPAQTAPAPVDPEPAAADPETAVEPEAASTVQAAFGSVVSPFPAMDPELVLTPATEADFAAAERPAWPADQRAAPSSAAEAVLFEDEPTLSVLRHEVEPAGPRRFDWSQTGAFLIMGATGLAACGASAAAFRKALSDDSSLNDYTVIGWVLALIGILCVGVSSWNLYVRWGKTD